MSTLTLSNDGGMVELRVSSNGRYLQTRTGDPVLITCDSPQGMLVDISTADMKTYFETRASQGFNMTQVHVVAGTTFGSPSSTTYETYDGVKPFSTNGDISTVNDTYFLRCDAMVELAQQNGIYVILSVADMVDAHDLWKTNGNTKCLNYGAYLGARYRAFNNILWMVGNDFQDWSTDSASVTALVNILDGIQSADERHPIYTAWLDYFVSGARDSTDFDNEITLDNAYTYYIAYDKVGTEYALSTAKPVFLVETYYFDETQLSLTGTAFIIRKQNYWTMMAGGCGTTVMNDFWAFATNWELSMSDACFTDMAHFRNLFEAYDWSSMVPDTGNSILTAGYGTKRSGAVQPDTDDFANCSYLADGSLAMIYMPENLTMTVDMSFFSSTVTARWYDPTDGSYTADAASPLSNSGTHEFSRATTNSAGATDWVLVLEV